MAAEDYLPEGWEAEYWGAPPPTRRPQRPRPASTADRFDREDLWLPGNIGRIARSATIAEKFPRRPFTSRLGEAPTCAPTRMYYPRASEADGWTTDV